MPRRLTPPSVAAVKKSARLPPRTRALLAAAARQAARASYSPYSHFPVGAAVLTRSGEVHSGTNVENASYGLCQCAERVALAGAVAAGARAFRAVCVYTPTPRPTAPCGACRQVIWELAPAARVLSVCDGPTVLERSIAELLPDAFGPDQLAPPAAGQRPVYQ